MATESSPFNEEQEIEESLTSELLALLALSLVFSVDNIVMSQFEPAQDYQNVQERFRSKVSEAYPILNSTSKDAVDIAINRASRDLGLKGLSIDYSDQIFSDRINEIFNRHMNFVSQTNRSMFNELRQIAFENGWSNQELARRLKDYYGLTPQHLRTILNMERALIADGIKKSTRNDLLRKRIDQLIEWRLNLISVQLSTEIVEGSKDSAFSYLVSTGQVSIGEYEKRWVSVIDDVTTQICLSSHNTRAEIGQNFPNGRPHPPAYPPVHECRSAIVLARKAL